MAAAGMNRNQDDAARVNTVKVRLLNQMASSGAFGVMDVDGLDNKIKTLIKDGNDDNECVKKLIAPMECVAAMWHHAGAILEKHDWELHEGWPGSMKGLETCFLNQLAMDGTKPSDVTDKTYVDILERFFRNPDLVNRCVVARPRIAP